MPCSIFVHIMPNICACYVKFLCILRSIFVPHYNIKYNNSIRILDNIKELLLRSNSRIERSSIHKELDNIKNIFKNKRRKQNG